ncbi:MAG: acyl carrier protein [Pseudomonadota bacterium]
MDESQIVSRLRDFIVENFLFGDASQAPAAEVSFLASGLIDSTGMLELVFFIEETWALHIADEDLIPDNLDSCQRIARFVARKLDAGATAQGGAV